MRRQAHSRSLAHSEPRSSPSLVDPQFSEPSLAVHRRKRNVKPRGEWWKVQPSTARTPERAPIPDPQEKDEEQEALEYNNDEVDELVMQAQSVCARWNCDAMLTLKRTNGCTACMHPYYYSHPSSYLIPSSIHCRVKTCVCFDSQF